MRDDGWIISSWALADANLMLSSLIFFSIFGLFNMKKFPEIDLNF